MTAESVLAEIVARKKQDVAIDKKRFPQAHWQDVIADMPPPRPFLAALRRAQMQGRLPVIAEIKQASPSAGVIRPDCDVQAIAQAYQTAGATCLSVLTEPHFFQGSWQALQTAKATTQLPILRKDFIIDSWQVIESRAQGADAILLIMAALEHKQAEHLYATAKEWQLDVLVEVHTKKEAERAKSLAVDMMGINNRNLKTLRVDLRTTATLAALKPSQCFLISESGIRSRQDMETLRSFGADGFLIGEYCMRQESPGQALRNLLQHETF